LPKLLDKIAAFAQQNETSEAIKYYDAFMKINCEDNANVTVRMVPTIVLLQTI